LGLASVRVGLTLGVRLRLACYVCFAGYGMMERAGMVSGRLRLEGAPAEPCVSFLPGMRMPGSHPARRSLAMTPTGLPRLVVFGEALTDLVRTGEDSWRSIAGGACWNVARVAATLGVETGWGGAVSDDLFGARLVELSREAGLDPRFLQVVPRPPLLAVVHQIDPPRYFFLGENAADLAFDEAALPAGWEAACQFVHFGCISLVRQPLGERLVALAVRL